MRIDQERFLTHMIDHFTLEDLTSIEYMIIGSVTGPGSQRSVQEKSRVSNVQKFNEFYPIIEIQEFWSDYRDKKALKKLYFEYLDDPKHRCLTLINDMIALLLKHVNICVVCKEHENVYIDLFCEYLEERFSVPCVDLNKLFIEGEVDEMYLDYDEINDKVVDLRRYATKQERIRKGSTRHGRIEILAGMTKKEKLKLCKQLDISITESDHKNLDRILIDGWVEEIAE